MPSMSRTSGNVTVLTQLTLYSWVPSEAFWAPTHCLVFMDMAESIGSTWIIDAWTHATSIITGLGVITIIISYAFWINSYGS